MSRLVEGQRCKMGQPTNFCVVDEHWEGYLSHSGARNPSLTPGSPARSTGAGKMSPHNIWL